MMWLSSATKLHSNPTNWGENGGTPTYLAFIPYPVDWGDKCFRLEYPFKNNQTCTAMVKSSELLNFQYKMEITILSVYGPSGSYFAKECPLAMIAKNTSPQLEKLFPRIICGGAKM